MLRSAPQWVSKTLFPFVSRWIEIDEYHQHYIDEGSGEVILFIHGTPEWSFGYRDLVAGLKSTHRCIAIDLIGFGLSDKPPGNVYYCRDHADRLTKFISALSLKNITLVVNDFGGGIGLSYAINNPDNVRSIVLFNTWMWSLKNDKHYSAPSKIINTWIGKFLYLTLNAPVNTIMPSAFGDKKKLTKQIHLHYKHALPDSSSRKGAYTFAQELMNASDWWQSLWEKRSVLSSKKILIFWGMKDTFIPPYELDKWKTGFPHAKVVVFADAGHFVQEEKSDEMIPEIESLLTS